MNNQKTNLVEYLRYLYSLLYYVLSNLKTFLSFFKDQVSILRYILPPILTLAFIFLSTIKKDSEPYLSSRIFPDIQLLKSELTKNSKEFNELRQKISNFTSSALRLISDDQTLTRPGRKVRKKRALTAFPSLASFRYSLKIGLLDGFNARCLNFMLFKPCLKFSLAVSPKRQAFTKSLLLNNISENIKLSTEFNLSTLVKDLIHNRFPSLE